MKRIAFYGGSFDPVHRGHIEIAEALLDQFDLDEFVFIPAFHAPHKPERKPTSAYHRFTMLCLATQGDPKIKVSKMEIDVPERPYTVETLTRLKHELIDTDIFFVMGADSWNDIRTWREWEQVLTLTNQIIVTRPGFPIDFSHVTDEIRDRIFDMREGKGFTAEGNGANPHVYVTDAVDINISATNIRCNIRENKAGWRSEVPDEVAKYIEKYELYK
jgi:nicotinate-nucleotide adenylyltransferase